MVDTYYIEDLVESASYKSMERAELYKLIEDLAKGLAQWRNSYYEDMTR